MGLAGRNHVSNYAIGDYIPMYWDGGEPPFELVKGHVSREAALLTLKREGIDMPETVTIRHEHARWVPVQGHPDYDLKVMMELEPRRGNFPVTAVEVAKCD